MTVPPTSLDAIRDLYGQLRLSWPAARSCGELRVNIGIVDDLLKVLEDKQTRWHIGDLWNQLDDLQRILRLELADRNQQPPPPAHREWVGLDAGDSQRRGTAVEREFVDVSSE